MRNNHSDALAAQLNNAYKRSKLSPARFIGVLTIIRSSELIEYNIPNLSFQAIITDTTNDEVSIAHFYFNEELNQWFCKF